MPRNERFGWFMPEEYAIGMRLDVLKKNELIDGLPERFFYRGLVTVLIDRKGSRGTFGVTYVIVFSDVPSPTIQTALRSLFGDRLFDAVFKNGEFAYEDVDGWQRLPEPTEQDFQHMFEALRRDLASQQT